jgi:hypothetical protein
MWMMNGKTMVVHIEKRISYVLILQGIVSKERYIHVVYFSFFSFLLFKLDFDIQNVFFACEQH